MPFQTYDETKQNAQMTKRADSGDFTILGIETSCDETAAAVVRGQPGEIPDILSNVVLSQVEEHRDYGGVVPEIAARAHIDHLDGIIADAMSDANVDYGDLSAVAGTAGPGLIGGVIVGLMTAKSIAYAHKLPFLAVNHLAGHALSPRISERLDFPYLLLLVSGGHCQLLAVEGPETYTRYGTTIDDAVGEAFDKTAKLLGLGYPGGPAVQKIAEKGNPKAVDLPRPLHGRDGCDFSFSGLKTAIARAADAVETPTDQKAADIAASFQAAVCDVIEDRTRNALHRFQQEVGATTNTLVVAGGVAANSAIRARLTELCAAERFRFVAPPLYLCTDNAAMIAWAGLERLAMGHIDPFDISPRARWPLSELGA